MGKLTAIKTKSIFQSLLNSSSINEHNIHFILDTGLIYTHGIYINGAAYGTEANDAINLSIAGVTKSLALSSHTHSNYLEKNSDIDIGSFVIKSRDNELIKWDSNKLILGSPAYITGTAHTTRNSVNYDILDTGNFSIEAKTSTNIPLLNVATIKYGGTSFQLDYVRRINGAYTFDNITYTSIGTTNINNQLYGIITMYTDGSTPASYALIRADIPNGKLEYRTSGSTAWKTLSTSTTSVFGSSGAGHSIGLVPDPGETAGTGKFLCEDGTWRTPTYTSDTNTWRDILVNGTQRLSNSINGGSLDFISGSNTTVEWTNDNKLKINSTWNANALGVAGYVAAPTKADNANMTWLTDADGNPAWRASNNHSHSYLPLSGGTISGGINPNVDSTINLGTVTAKYHYIYAHRLIRLQSIAKGDTYDSYKLDLPNKSGTIAVTSDLSNYLPLSGGTMTGALHFANNTWNNVGDDVQMGDHNVAGALGLLGINGNTRIDFCQYGNSSNYKSIVFDGTTLFVDGNCNYASKARYIEGDADAANPGGAMIRSGSGRPDSSPSGDTWIFWDTLGGTSSPWGIRHNQANNSIGFIGSGTEWSRIPLYSGISGYIGSSLTVGSNSDPSQTLDVRGNIVLGNSTGETHIYARTSNFNNPALSFYDDTSGYGTMAVLGGGGCTVVGGGESAHEFAPNVRDENLYLTADVNVDVYTNLDGGYGSRRHVANFNANGNTYLYGRIYANEWIQFDSWTGLYSPNNNAHFYPNNTTSYGAWQLRGTRGGYSGIHFGDSTHYMTLMDDYTDKGIYQEDQRWIIYYNASNGKVSLRDSSDLGADINLIGSVRTNSTYYGYGLYHLSYGSSAYALTSDGGAAHIGSMSVNYASSAGSASYATRLDGGGIAGWGTLTSSNGFSGIAAYDWGDKGAFCWAGKGGQMYMQLDGYFYQREGLYRCLDTADNVAWRGAPNNLVHAGNEITMIPDSYSGDLWLNYQSVGRNSSSNITAYIFGNGRGSSLASILSNGVHAPNFYTTSDRNKKQNISILSEHIRKFQLKDSNTWHYGVIALEVPEMFRDGEEGNMTVNYNSILSYYIGLLENKVASLERELISLKQKLK